MLSAIDIINSATAELGLPTVTTSTAGPDDLGPQMLSLLNALCQELLTMHDWQFLMRTVKLVNTNPSLPIIPPPPPEPQEYFDLPVDFARQVNQTQWNETNRTPMVGPNSAKQWGWVQYGLVGAGAGGYNRYRYVGNKMQVYPPIVDEELIFYYMSNYCIQDGVDPSVYKSTIVSEDDIPLFDSRVLISGLKVKIWAIKGLDTTLLQQEAANLLSAYKAQNQGAAEINLANGSSGFLLGYGNVPDTGYGV